MYQRSGLHMFSFFLAIEVWRLDKWFRVLRPLVAALPGDLGSVPSTRLETTICNCSAEDLMPSPGLLSHHMHTYGAQIYM